MQPLGVRLGTVLLGVAFAVSGCNSLPRAGADHRDVENQATLYYGADKLKPFIDYVLVELSEKVLSFFPQKKQQTLARGFGPTRKGAPSLPLGIGDVIEITLFESSAGGLFIPNDAGSRPGNFISLPNQAVDTDGMISVPYAGRIMAAGRTPAQVQAEIVAKLSDRAIEPQAVINLITSRSSEVAVLGDVNGATKLAINPGGERVLDVIARAGGISTPNAETNITLQRNGTSATVPFELLLSNPKENIYVFPGDVIIASRDRRTYLAFGASGLNGRIDFEDSDLNLAEAVGKAGGLLDARADPAQVFLYRLVDPKVLSDMGTPVTAKSGQGFPVVFRINMRDPSAYFLARQFPMEDKDILYVSNADSVELIKFLSLVNSVTAGTAGPVADAVTIKNGIRTLKN